MQNNEESIDLVITWVDHQDKEWQSLKQQYESGTSTEGNHLARFRNWDNLKYVFRSIEKYMPWVRKVFLVTFGHYPSWLNLDCDKLEIVSHKDFIPQEFLPTFSSHTIELNLHRIQNLSERFIYFNDDIFVLRPLETKDFFYQGFPCDNAILHVHCEKRSLMIHTIANNDIALINDHFDMKESISKNRKNWFNLKYGIRNNIQNLFFYQCPRFPGFRQYHMANSYLKSSFKEVWEKEREYLTEVCSHKFRTSKDVNQWVIREWQLAKNIFYPYPKFKMGKMIDFEKDNQEIVLKECKLTIEDSKYKMICINDGDTLQNFEYIRDEVNQALEKKYPEKSNFER